MPRRTRRPRRARRGLTVGLLVLASIAIITLDYRGQAHGVISGAKRAAHDAFAPVQRGVDALVHPVGSFLSGAVHGGDLQAQNAKLRREIGTLRRQALISQAARDQLRTLERLDQLPWVGDIPTVTAQVIALEPVGLRRHGPARQGDDQRRGAGHAGGGGCRSRRPGHRRVVVGVHGPRSLPTCSRRWVCASVPEGTSPWSRDRAWAGT